MTIDQTGLSAGVAGVSRTDGLLTGALVTITSVGGGSTHLVELLDVPLEDINAVASLVQNGGDPTIWTFTPTANQPGTFRIKLTEDLGLPSESVQIRVLRMRTPRNGIILPAMNERADDEASLVNSGAPFIDASEDNATDYTSSSFYNGRRYSGWWRFLHEFVVRFDDIVKYDASANACFGQQAGDAISAGTANTLIGSTAGDAITTGGSNTCVGSNAGGALQNGSGNTFIGEGAGQSCVSGSSNTFIGDGAAESATGIANVVIGIGAANNLLGGDSNLIIAGDLPDNRSNFMSIKNVITGRNLGTSPQFAFNPPALATIDTQLGVLGVYSSGDGASILELESGGPNAGQSLFFVGDRVPTNNVAGNPGSYYIRESNNDSRVFQQLGTGSNSTDWTQLQLASTIIVRLSAPGSDVTPDGTWTKIPGTTVAVQTTGPHFSSPAAARITVDRAGIYKIRARATMIAGDSAEFALGVNGVAPTATAVLMGGATGAATDGQDVEAVLVQSFAASDFIEPFVRTFGASITANISTLVMEATMVD